jgi:bacterioferritin-associated ferredoxin
LVSITTLPTTPLGRQLAVTAERHRHHDHIAEPSGVRCGHCLRSAAELLDEARQGLRPTRVADRHLVAGIDEVLGKRAADVPGADDPDPHLNPLRLRDSRSRTTAEV